VGGSCNCPGTTSSGPAGASGSTNANDNTNINTNTNQNTNLNTNSDQPSASPRLGDDKDKADKDQGDKKTGLDRADDAAGQHGQQGRDNARDKQQR